MINVLSAVAELNVGGGESRLLNLARSIDRTRFRHTVVTLYAEAPRPDCSSMRRQFIEAGVRVHDLALPHPATARGPRPLRLAATARTLALAVARLRRLIVSRRIDLVDGHLEAALYTGVPAAAAVGVPSTVTLYSELDLWAREDRGAVRRAVLPVLRRLELQRCSGIITDSRARAGDWERFVGPGAPPLDVIPNGVRLAPPARSAAEVRRELGIPPGTTVLGQVAGLVPFKGQAVLLEATGRLVAAGHDVFVLCVGDERKGAAYSEELRSRAARLGLAGRVRIQRWPGSIADAWGAIDIHVHASSVDSMPNAVLEGMSLGKPAVLSTVGGVPDHVDDGQTGLLVPPNDPGALAGALLRMLHDPALRARLGAGALGRYRERFTPEVVARQIEGCFERVIERWKSRSRAVASR